MLINANFSQMEQNNPYAAMKRSYLAEHLAMLQRQCIHLNIPALIIVEGWESSGKGYVISDLARELDTRAFSVHVFERDGEEEEKRSFSWRFWTRIPAKGDFAIFDRSSYYDMMNDLSLKKGEVKESIARIHDAEKMLFDDGTVILKFFLNISKETQQERISELFKDDNRKFLITKNDTDQNKHYKKYQAHFSDILNLSNYVFAPWHLVSAEDRKSASKYILGTSIRLLQEGVDRHLGKQKTAKTFIREYQHEATYLQELKTDLFIDEATYIKKSKVLQQEVQELAYALYTNKVPTILVFEGMDAAGKGGAIKRLTKSMDPRGYTVNPTSAPSDAAKDHHYLWRFYNNFPKRGVMSIFDRSWYGRVLVERVEGFATPAEWERAYGEITAMEQELADFGALILKFFIYIDKDEQYRRFTARQEDKPYKLTDEDWRNRDKWDAYVLASNEMIDRTSTTVAPWILVEGNDKPYARVKVLTEFNQRARAMLQGLQDKK